LNRWLTRRVALLSIVICALALYSNSLSNGFHYDDREVIVHNPLIRQIAPLQAFTSASFDHAGRFTVFRPLLLLSYALNYRIGGLNPFGYHVVNVFLHLLAGLLVYLLVSTTAAGGDPQNKPPRLFPWLAALFFVAHPINTETVNYVWARSTSLATVWYLVAIACFVRATDPARQARPRQKFLWMGCALAAFIVALFSKEIGITLPAVLLLTDLCYSPREQLRRRLVVHLPFWAVAAAYAAFMCHHLIGPLSVPPPRSVAVNLLTQMNVILQYIRLLLLPIGLNVFHVVPEACSITSFPTPYSLLGISALLVLAVAAYSRWRVVTFATLWFFITLLPTSSVLPLKVLMNEHRLYLPGIGFCVLLAAALCGPVRRRFPRGALVAAAAILALYSLGTVERNTVWRDEVTLWADALRKSPGRVEAHVQIGIGYVERGMLDAAVAEYEQALRIYPYLPQVHYDLGNVYLRKKMYLRAMEEYKRMLELLPSSAQAHYALGIAYGAQLDFARALGHLVKAKELDPSHPDAARKIELMRALGQLYAQAMKALAQDAGVARGNFMLGNVYANLGRFGDAVECYERSLQANPSQYAAELALARIYLNELGDQEAAVAHLRRAAALCPDKEERERLLAIADKLSRSR